MSRPGRGGSRDRKRGSPEGDVAVRGTGCRPTPEERDAGGPVPPPPPRPPPPLTVRGLNSLPWERKFKPYHWHLYLKGVKGAKPSHLNQPLFVVLALTPLSRGCQAFVPVPTSCCCIDTFISRVPNLHLWTNLYLLLHWHLYLEGVNPSHLNQPLFVFALTHLSQGCQAFTSEPTSVCCCTDIFISRVSSLLIWTNFSLLLHWYLYLKGAKPSHPSQPLFVVALTLLSQGCQAFTSEPPSVCCCIVIFISRVSSLRIWANFCLLLHWHLYLKGVKPSHLNQLLFVVAFTPLSQGCQAFTSLPTSFCCCIDTLISRVSRLHIWTNLCCCIDTFISADWLICYCGCNEFTGITVKCLLVCCRSIFTCTCMSVVSINDNRSTCSFCTCTVCSSVRVLLNWASRDYTVHCARTHVL